MKDPAVPSLSISKEGAITITISSTDAQVYSQGYAYNQAGFTYNQAGVSYGGVYNIGQDVIPLSLSITQTDAGLSDQGYTYNQTGFSYNQTGVTYGGISNSNQDIVPLTLTFEDIYTPKPVIGINNGPGWFMYVNLT